MPTKKPAAKTPAAKKSAPAAKKPAAEKPAVKKPAAGGAAKKSAPAAKKPEPAATANKPAKVDVKPFVLMPPSEDGGPMWTVMLADSHSPSEVFEEFGHTGSGYSWDSVARIALKDLSPEQSDSFEFDSEAGTFVAMTEDAEAAQALASALVALIRDEDALREAIEAVPEDDWDD